MGIFASQVNLLKAHLASGGIATSMCGGSWSPCLRGHVASVTGLLGLLIVAQSYADAPPWDIWHDLHSLAEVRPGQRVLLKGSHCPSG